MTDSIILDKGSGFLKAIHPGNPRGDVVLRGRNSRHPFYLKTDFQRALKVADSMATSPNCSVSTNRYLGEPLLLNFLQTSILFVRVKCYGKDVQSLAKEVEETLSSNSTSRYTFFTHDGDECTFVWQLDCEFKFHEIGLYLRVQNALFLMFQSLGSIDFLFGESDFLSVPGSTNSVSKHFVYVNSIGIDHYTNISKSTLVKAILRCQQVSIEKEIFSSVFVCLRCLFDKRWFRFSFSENDFSIAIQWLPALYGCLYNMYSEDKIRKELIRFSSSLANQPWNQVKDFFQPVIDRLEQNAIANSIFICGRKFNIESTDWLKPALDELEISLDELEDSNLKQLKEILEGNDLTIYVSDHLPVAPIGDSNFKSYQEFITLLSTAA